MVLVKTELNCTDRSPIQKAAEGESVKAIHDLVLYYKNGKEIEKNLGKAFHWFQKAAEGVSVKAMCDLAFCYYNGEETEKDLRKAFYWFQKE
jgi:TPR repeat protein